MLTSRFLLLISDNMFPPRFHPKFLSISVLVCSQDTARSLLSATKQNSLERFDTCGCVLVITRIVTEVTDLQRNFSSQRKSNQQTAELRTNVHNQFSHGFTLSCQPQREKQ